MLADATTPGVRVQFHDLPTRTHCKQVMDTGLAYYPAHRPAARPWGWVGKVRDMGAIPKEVQRWLLAEWNPRAYAAGIREISIVVSNNVFGQLATQQYVQNTACLVDPYDLELELASDDSLPAAQGGPAADVAGRLARSVAPAGRLVCTIKRCLPLRCVR